MVGSGSHQGRSWCLPNTGAQWVPAQPHLRGSGVCKRQAGISRGCAPQGPVGGTGRGGSLFFQSLCGIWAQATLLLRGGWTLSPAPLVRLLLPSGRGPGLRPCPACGCVRNAPHRAVSSDAPWDAHPGQLPAAPGAGPFVPDPTNCQRRRSQPAPPLPSSPLPAHDTRCCPPAVPRACHSRPRVPAPASGPPACPPALLPAALSVLRSRKRAVASPSFLREDRAPSPPSGGPGSLLGPGTSPWSPSCVDGTGLRGAHGAGGAPSGCAGREFLEEVAFESLDGA